MNKKRLVDWFNAPPYAPEDVMQKIGARKALRLFHEAAQRVPAYKAFLRSHHIDHTKIRSINDFSSIPQTSKENYIERYPEGDRLWDGSYQDVQMISTSSGTTGSAHYWPRSLNHEIDGAKIHEYIFRSIFFVHEKRTLFINGFAMGNWIAGTFTLACANLVSWKGYPLTIMTPGYSLDHVIEILRDISPQFDQTILCGHTPFLKEIIDEADRQHVNLSSLHIKLLGSGQGITEQWRSYLLRMIHADSHTRTIINLYGSADASLMGFETPESIEIRRKVFEKHAWENLFSDTRMPSLYCFDPRLIYLEGQERTIVITKDMGCPLIRYNIQDEGGVVDQERMGLFSASHSIDLPKFPMIYLFGRSKFMVKLYGANIYVDHVQQAFDNEQLQQYISGRFLLEIQEDESHQQVLVCRVELKKDVSPRADLMKRIQKVFIEEVSKLNKEYAYILGALKEKVYPIIHVHEHSDEQYFPLNKVKKTA